VDLSPVLVEILLRDALLSVDEGGKKKVKKWISSASKP